MSNESDKNSDVVEAVKVVFYIFYRNLTHTSLNTTMIYQD